MHNTAEFTWRQTTTQDDACAPFSPPALALTGATVGGTLGATALVQGAAALVLAGGGILLGIAVRRRRRGAHSPQ